MKLSVPENDSSQENNTKKDIVYLWILRMLVDLGGYEGLLKSTLQEKRNIFNYLGLQGLFEIDDFEDGESALWQHLKNLFENAEKNKQNYLVHPILLNNVQKLSTLLGFTKVDSKIIEFVITINTDLTLILVSDLLGKIEWTQAVKIMSVTLDVDYFHVRNSLKKDGCLVRSGLFSIKTVGAWHLKDIFNIIFEGNYDSLCSWCVSPINLLKRIILPCDDHELEFEDFSYLGDILDFVINYFKNATMKRQSGVNALIYGVPGTGKTHLSRIIANKIGCDLHEITCVDGGGDFRSGEYRLRVFDLAQRILVNSRSMVVFDEIEDVFTNVGCGSAEAFSFNDERPNDRIPKAWINRALENNPVPTIWISNSIRSIDPAIIPRFGVVLNLENPTQKQRNNIISKKCGDILSPQFIDNISSIESLSPAVINKAVSVVRGVKTEIPDQNIDEIVETLVENTLIAHADSLKGKLPRIGEQRHSTGGETSKILDSAEASILAIRKGRDSDSLKHVSPILERTIDHIKALLARTDGITGVPTGFADLDRLTGGFQKSDLIILAGRPSIGKTAFALNLTMHAAIPVERQDSTGEAFAVAFFSLDMSRDQILTRLLCSLGDLDLRDIRTGRLHQDSMVQVTEAASKLNEAPIYIDDTPAIGVLEMRAKSRRLKSMLERQGVDLGMIIVDYLQLMRGTGASDTREQEISEISRLLKELAKELNVPVLALSALNRRLEIRPDNRPRLSDLRESGSIEQDADVVAFVYREEVYKRDNEELRGLAELIVGKQRNGPIGNVPLVFRHQCARFGSRDREYYY